MTLLSAYLGAEIFDGRVRHENAALLVDGARIAGIVPAAEVPEAAQVHRLGGGTIAPGFVDLQVNGGDGVMLNEAPSADTLHRMAQAHLTTGTTGLLPTLITDTPDVTRATIEATVEAVTNGTPGILGLHLEGPHLSVARKGAHDPALICPMEDADLALYLDAARRLPVLKITLAPENATMEQISALTAAGVLVSLGHTDADYATCMAAAKAGARCVTHLFNAMSQLGNRAPGCVGAALDCGGFSTGLIADGIHVHPATIRAALAAKRAPGAVFLVTDAMAPTGTAVTEFELGGRRILRRDGQLTLEDGTLAGADLDFPRALRVMVEDVGVPVDQALAMATTIPAALIGTDVGTLATGAPADFVHLDAGLHLAGVWHSGARQ